MSREDEIKAIGEKIVEERSLMDRNGWTKGIIPIEWGEVLLTENARLRAEIKELRKPNVPGAVTKTYVRVAAPKETP